MQCEQTEPRVEIYTLHCRECLYSDLRDTEWSQHTEANPMQPYHEIVRSVIRRELSQKHQNQKQQKYDIYFEIW